MELLGRRLCCASVVVATALCATTSASTLYEDYSAGIAKARDVQSLGEGAFGDTIDPYTGRVDFYVEDLSIPGNGGLDISIGRSIEAHDTGFRPSIVNFASVTLSIPRLEGVFATKSGGWVAQSDSDYRKPNVNRCSAITKAPPEVDGSRQNTSFESNEYWHGNHLVIPGRTNQLMLEAGPLVPGYEWSTVQNWAFSCLAQTSNGVPGEGFLAFSPDGVKYYFDRVIQHQTVERIEKPDSTLTNMTNLDRTEWYIYPSKVEDRFGNTLTYAYNGDRIAEIMSSDGRRVSFVYLPDGSLSSIISGSRTWHYSDGLRRVIYPDGSVWNMSLSGAFAKDPYAFKLYSCAKAPSSLITGQATITIDLPSGARGVFNFAPNRRGVSYVPSNCASGSDPGPGIVKVIDDIALTTKTITGPGLTPATWTYSAGPANDSFSSACSSGCVDTRSTQLSRPDGSSERNTFSNRHGATGGDLLLHEIYSASGELFSKTAYTYEHAQFANSDTGWAPLMAGDRFSAQRRAVRTRVVTRDGATFSWQALSLDGYARPLSVSRFSSSGRTITEDSNYHDNFAKWVVGQTRSVTCVAPAACRTEAAPNGTVVSQIDFDPATAMPLRRYAFGKLQDAMTYNADGTLATVTDGNNKTTTFSAWKRGVPQKIQYPATPESPGGAIKSAVVSDDGTIASVTDETHSRTCYGYDAMGRLASITNPSELQADVCDTSAWAATTIAMVPLNGAEYGIPAGHWRQTTSTGNARRIMYFDALWRPLVNESYDAADPSGTRSITVNRYDAGGRLAFQSYPRVGLAGYADAMSGTNTYFDALDRVTQVDQDSELGTLTTLTKYLAGFQTRVINPRLMSTTTTYMAYDEPTMTLPLTIVEPEGVVTEIVRDVFGKPLAINRLE
jgi:YD repeat-containing protein